VQRQAIHRVISPVGCDVWADRYVAPYCHARRKPQRVETTVRMCADRDTVHFRHQSTQACGPHLSAFKCNKQAREQPAETRGAGAAHAFVQPNDQRREASFPELRTLVTRARHRCFTTRSCQSFCARIQLATRPANCRISEISCGLAHNSVTGLAGISLTASRASASWSSLCATLTPNSFAMRLAVPNW